MNLIWQKVAFIACLGFTALMAGANLAHMTATANGAPVPLLGFEIPHKTIMAVGAVCVDVIIIISPFALRYRHVNGQHTAFFVVLALWLGCSLVSIQSVHDWLAESAQATAAPAVSAERQYHDLKTTLDESRVRLKSIKEKLLKEEDYGKRRILLNEEKRQKDDIDVMEKKFWQAQVVPMPKPDDMEHWVKAVILWALSVGCWVGFLGDEGTPKVATIGDTQPSPVIPPITRSGDGSSRVAHTHHYNRHETEKHKENQGDGSDACSDGGDGYGDTLFHVKHHQPSLSVVAGTDHPSPPVAAITSDEQPSIDKWMEIHLTNDNLGSLRPDEAWRSFIKEGYANGYTKEEFYKKLKEKMGKTWKRTNVGVVYKGVRLI